ncbi:MAG: carboxypeptidase regulatory-like domain-containing protein [Pyrinomonadaceae bacterium]|nr:carboxypeptidase regulatory-like domain-containing protein [Pyrinomonadaceae bacterium]
MVNDGTIDLQGGGANCPQTDSILIRSSSGVQRSWTGGGRYRLVDVDVQDMGGTGTKTVFSGTNSGGNNASWIFNSGCPTALSISPTSATVQSGTTQTFTASGGFPDYTFSISTNNSGATINPTTGVYTAGTTSGTDTVRVTDVFGTTADASVTVNSSFFVTNTNDSGAGSLRQAIFDANNTPGTQIIRFNIAGTAPFTITPNSELPALIQPIIIDGTTQPGFNGTPIVELNGTNAVTNPCLRIFGGNSTVKGLVINRCRFSAIFIFSGGGSTIQGNYIGTNVAGNAAQGNGIGITIFESSDNLIGGTTTAARNVISGNSLLLNVQDSGTGILIKSTAAPNFIQGNFIGTNAAGTAAVPNGVGISIAKPSPATSSSGNTIGGTIPGTRNVISGNTEVGIVLHGTLSNQILGNFIGTDLNGSAAVPNGFGLYVFASVYDTKIGGTAAGESNVIAFNNFSGIATIFSPISPSERNAVRGNSIHSNVFGGIDLNGEGITPNDAAFDADSGANTLQNFPVLTSATTSGGNLIVNGTLNSKPSQTFTVDFYSSAACDASGNGEGEIFLGSTNVTTDAGGIVGFTASLPVTVAGGRFITATATDAAGNTSEFSQCRAASGVLHAIVGRLTSDGQPLADTEVRISGSTIAPFSRLTNRLGNYAFFSLPAGGNYTVTPVKPGFLFSPVSRTYNNLSANQINQDFTAAQPNFTISGRVQSTFAGTTAALGGVTLTLSSGATTQTDSNGNYVFNSLPMGNYILTATKANYTFTPLSRTFTPLDNNQTANFTAQSNTLLNGRIAYNDGSGLSIMNADGSAAVRLFNDSFSPALTPAISPNGSKIAFTKYVPLIVNPTTTSYNSRVFIMNFDGTNQQQITPDGTGGVSEISPVWSPDGTKIAFVRRGSTSQIKVINLNTSGETSVTSLGSGVFSIGRISWSPDGTKIAYEVTSFTSSVIRVINSDGSGSVQEIASLAGKPSWSPDGTKIAFIKYASVNSNPGGQIALMNPNGTNVSILTSDAQSAINEVDWSPDGAYLVFHRKQFPTFGIISQNGTPVVSSNDIRFELDWGTAFSPATLTGGNVNITAGVTSVTFGNVTGAGQTTVIPIPPNSAGTLPGGFAVSGFGAYEITTTANVTPPINVCFTVPAVLPLAQFNQIVILHRENGILVPKPTTRDFPTRRVCALVNSLSPFVIAEQINAALPSITGLAQDANGNPLRDVEIKLTGAANRTTTTDSNGLFTFPNLTAGANYNVQPKQIGYIFSEYNQDFVNLAGENTIVFTGTANDFQIGGRVLNANGNGIGAVRITLDGAISGEVLTDADGNYVFTNLPADGDYLITAVSGNANSFAPPQIFINALTGNISGADFMQFAPTAASASVGGRVRSANGKAISGARVSLTDSSGITRSARTNFQGRYRFDGVPAGDTYIISVSHQLLQFVQNTQIQFITGDNFDIDFVTL